MANAPLEVLTIPNVLALLNGVELKIATEFNIRPANSSIILEPGIGKAGDILEIYIRDDGEYAFGSVEVTITQNTWVETPRSVETRCSIQAL